jgi:homoserine O-succinyltransferase/O-acetyltransferase
MIVLPIGRPQADLPNTPDWDGSGLDCALVNNMPDSAFAATERQFAELLDAGSGRQPLRVRLFTLPSIPRSDAISEQIAARYSSLEELEQDIPDVLVVSGANPVEARIQDEPFWGELARLLSWASDHVPTMMLSCLSAHAALTVFDGIERQPLATKCTGVFAQTSDSASPLAAHLGRAIRLPHSRWNDVPMASMRAAGYDLPLYSEEVGWSVATRQVGRSSVLLMQAHPEYGATNLLREYERDARRYVEGERDAFPVLPRQCVARRDWSDLVRLQQRILEGERDPALIESFPFRTIGSRAKRTWRKLAIQLFADSLTTVPSKGH